MVDFFQAIDLNHWVRCSIGGVEVVASLMLQSKTTRFWSACVIAFLTGMLAAAIIAIAEGSVRLRPAAATR